jgi:hypothetical protein
MRGMGKEMRFFRFVRSRQQRLAVRRRYSGIEQAVENQHRRFHLADFSDRVVMILNEQAHRHIEINFRRAIDYGSIRRFQHQRPHIIFRRHLHGHAAAQRFSEQDDLSERNIFFFG